MPVPQSAVTPEERLARDERAACDVLMSQRDESAAPKRPDLSDIAAWRSAVWHAHYAGCPEPDYGHWKRTGEVWPGQRASRAPVDPADPNLLLDCDARPGDKL